MTGPDSAWLAGAVFLAGYAANMLVITVLYHRGLAHSAVQLSPLGRWAVQHLGIWVTGLDPKAWVCMHRQHHLHADTPRDPHSPANGGLLSVAHAQYRSYVRTLVRLERGDEKLGRCVSDIEYPTSWLNRRRLWFLPLVLHLALGIGLGAATGVWLVGLAFVLGISSHPVQGWLVNALGHARGYRRFDTPDDSTNNLWVAWVCFGEGYQNNHHKYPSRAKFGERWFEFDLGYLSCIALWLAGFVHRPQPGHTPDPAHPMGALSSQNRTA